VLEGSFSARREMTLYRT